METFIPLAEEQIKRKIASGIVLSSGKRFILQAIMSTSNIVLARILAPEIFGSFSIISFLILTIGLLSNFGLGPSMIQRYQEITKAQLQSIFTVLCSGALVFAGVIYISAPAIAYLYHGGLGVNGIFWLRLFSFAVLIDHLGAISRFQLERSLAYRKMTLVEIVTMAFTYFIIIVLALKGFGIGSFVLGKLIGGIATIIMYYIASPWPVGIRFSLTAVKPFLPFGFNYQANTLINAVNSAVVPGFVGVVSGAQSVGFVQWAAGIRQVGLAPFDMVERLLFPAASRLQNNQKLLGRMIEKMIKLSCLLSFPLLAALFALAPAVISIIYTSNWMAGLTTLYLSLIQGIFILLSTLLIDVLLALGYSKKVRNISLFWAAAQWLLTIPLVIFWNFNGVVIAGLLVSTTFFIPLREVRKDISISIWPNVLPYILYSVICGVCMFILASLNPITTIWMLILTGCAGMCIYAGILFAFERKKLAADFIQFKKLLF